eukprot:GHVR01079868.1.p1 GENE.GHVR01079868.1~~GHVR01079868.1.p1  ORF type:complete len:930 (+),score=210.99 GHVR01079868.1:1392-4181(+)
MTHPHTHTHTHTAITQRNAPVATVHDLKDPRTVCSFLLKHLKTEVSPYMVSTGVSLLDRCKAEVMSCLARNNNGELVVSDHKGIIECVIRILRDIVKDRKSEIGEHLNQLSIMQSDLKKSAWLRAVRNDVGVVGMTSTFAAINCDFLKQMRTKICVVEEPGELLEGQLVVCLSSPSLEHLVMIGDHQQLRPKINTYALKVQKNFDISLFERLVRLKPCIAALSTQLRMRPEISRLVSPFYASIVDHPRVLQYPHVKGVGACVYFITHTHTEESGEAMGATKSNRFEASYCTRLAKHIFYQEQYEPHEITLLTPYQGQRRLMYQLLDNRMKGDTSTGVKGTRVVTVDDYQGEENKIVILSLVRSNAQGVSGFTKIQNRIIVALSRAKHGLYIVGDGEMLSSNTQGGDWVRVIEILKSYDQYGPSLPLHCVNHPTITTTSAASCDDFDQYSFHGGCKERCNKLLNQCGHRCPLFCHPYNHGGIVCNDICVRPRPDGCIHKCSKLCNKCTEGPGSVPTDICASMCEERVEETLSCGHSSFFPCHVKTRGDTLKCPLRITLILPCKHTRDVLCHERDLPSSRVCTHEETCTGSCGHTLKIKCKTKQPCTGQCTHTFSCHHTCKGLCSDGHTHEGEGLRGVQCEASCSIELMCGHKCKGICSRPCLPCSHVCMVTCVHGFMCNKECHEICTPCNMSCAWICPHFRCTLLCYEKCNRPPCNASCDVTLECGHRCVGLCGEPCPPCATCEAGDEICSITQEEIRTATPEDPLYVLPECGHVFFVSGMDLYFESTIQSTISNNRAKHIQMPACPVCRIPVYTAGRYNRYIKEAIDLITKVKKKKMELSITEERIQIDRAMRTGGGRNHAEGNHWFSCPCGAIYYIDDCGGATETATCPECRVTIGGTGHTLATGNVPLNDFTGANVPHAFGHNLGRH